MNYWRQTKTYQCMGCGWRLLHDRMHGHVSYHCPARHQDKPSGPSKECDHE